MTDLSSSGSARDKPMVQLVCQEEALAYPHEIKMKLERDTKLSEYMSACGRMLYHYEFGEKWQHDIVVGKHIDDYSRNHPVCLEGEGLTPSKDVGGEDGYESFLEIIADPKHPVR